MENTGGLLLALVLLLALAITGPDFSADARMAAEWNFPFEKGVDTPMNLSGNYVGKHFEVPVEDKSAKKNDEEGLDVDISFPPAFDTVNNLQVDLRVQCMHSYPNDGPPLLVNEIVPRGERHTYFLYMIDPGNQHVTYDCTWYAEGDPARYLRTIAWADDNHQRKMPFYCIDCIWRVQDDGLYLYNNGLKFWSKVKDWCTSVWGC